jgi:hypothetical protein
MTGIWVLIMILYTSRYEIETIPIQVYDDIGFGYNMCISDRNELSLKFKTPLACVRMGEA